jgi:hypothetical protein
LVTHILVFNVGRGLSVFIRTPTNHGLICDAGNSEDFEPCEFLKEHILPSVDKYGAAPIAQTVLSHPHQDHISSVQTLKDDPAFYCGLHTCPNEKLDEFERLDWKRVNNRPGTEDLVAAYKAIYEKRTPPLQTLKNLERAREGLSYGLYYVAPPKVSEFYSADQDYTNGTSIVMWYRHGAQTILLPGDCTPDMLARLIDAPKGKGVEKRFTQFDDSGDAANQSWTEATGTQPILKTLLGDGLSILVAPHHGLESCYCERLYEICLPGLVVISEKRHLSETDGTVDARYQSEDGAAGQTVTINGEEAEAYSVSTRSGHILIKLDGSNNDPEVFVESDPEGLLDHM